MKLLRVGQKGKEKPAVLDKEGKIRDISSYITDLSPDYVNFETVSKLQNTDLSHPQGYHVGDGSKYSAHQTLSF